MRILLIVMANVLVVVASVLGVNEFFGLRRYASFVVPFTNKMVDMDIIPAGEREKLLREDRIAHIMGIGLSLLLSAMLGLFIAGISAVPVFGIATAAQLMALKPDMTENTATRTQYYNAHKDIMDALKYHAYLETVEDASPADSQTFLKNMNPGEK